jgi:hypothetical protein
MLKLSALQERLVCDAFGDIKRRQPEIGVSRPVGSAHPFRALNPDGTVGTGRK